MAEKRTTLKELIQDIDYRLSHLEDIYADNRTIMVKLVKQGNTIVEFLKQLEVSEIDKDESLLSELPGAFDNKSESILSTTVSLRELLDNYMERHKDLKELEEELEKHKDEITPGQIGES